MKTCKKCNISKALSEFNKQKDTYDGLRSWCKDCFNLNSLEWRQENPEQSKQNVREWHDENVDYDYRRTFSLKKRYGITQEDFERLHNQQNGLCALCSKPFKKIARVEHCHTTGKVRGLVCDGCNLNIAYYEKFEKNPELIEKIVKYLEK